MHASPLTSWLSARPPANDVRSAVRDARIARALRAMTERPADPWTVAKLAKVAGMSRASFARRFAIEVGSPPLHHLAALRISRAAMLSASTDRTLYAIAREIGYANEFALSRAFRRLVGEPPSVHRRRAQSPAAAPVTRCLAA